MKGLYHEPRVDDEDSSRTITTNTRLKRINVKRKSKKNSKHYEAKLCILWIVSGFHNKNAPFFFFCFFIFFDRSDKILACLKTCLWNAETYRHKNLRLSSAQFGLVMKNFKNYATTILKSVFHFAIANRENKKRKFSSVVDTNFVLLQWDHTRRSTLACLNLILRSRRSAWMPLATVGNSSWFSCGILAPYVG